MNFANLFTFPKWGKGDRGAVDEDVKKFEGKYRVRLRE